MRRAVLLALTLASCFSPDYPENVTCGPGGFCPEGQTCGADNLCHTAGTPDAALPSPDAAIVDATSQPDRAIFDAPVDSSVPPIDASPDAFVPPVDASPDAFVPPPPDAGDTTPPTASYSPTTSVLADDVCVTITFSEPMNTASVTLAGPLASLAYTTTWAGNVLTICPSTSYWPATDPSRALIVTGSDLAGNPMTVFTISYVAPPLEMFITASSTTAALGGLSGADGICQAEATAAGLRGTFVAWLSSSASDAYCRVHGRTGVRSSACGLATLPTGAGPWIRRDAQPFMELVGGVPRNFTPPTFLAAGTPAAGATTGSGLKLWTNTSRDGSPASAGSCTGWTSAGATESTVTGDTAVVMYFSNGSTSVCNNAARLVCMEVGRGGPLPTNTTPGRKIFISSATGTGNISSWTQSSGLSGLAGGDQICRTLAHSAGLPGWGTFKAWLSTSSVSAISRLTGSAPYVRMDGLVLASSKADLSDGVLATSVMFLENGVADDWNVFTGTTSAGTSAASNCSNWASGASPTTAAGGRTDFVSGRWTDEGTVTCGNTYRIYCVEDLCPTCVGTKWQCPQSCLCLDPPQVCDSVTDCPDGEDEAGCP